MNKRKAFHTTESIGKDFTDKEWRTHCEDVRHGRKSDIAFEYHGFKYNYNDICLNPKEVFSWRGEEVVEYGTDNYFRKPRRMVIRT